MMKICKMIDKPFYITNNQTNPNDKLALGDYLLIEHLHLYLIKTLSPQLT